jgi:hypothetical protein
MATSWQQKKHRKAGAMVSRRIGVRFCFMNNRDEGRESMPTIRNLND